MIADAAKHLGVPQTYAKYRLYKPADLVDTAIDRSSVIDGSVKRALAYIAAQGAALRGDAQAAAVAVRQLKETTLPTNKFDQERIGAIHRFTIVSGAFGIPTQERFWAEQAEQTQKTIFLILAACVFAAVAVLTSSFGRGITRRGFRISSIGAELRRYQGMPWAGTRNKDGSVFGRRTDTVPASVMSGESAMDAISSRLRVYAMLCAGCCSISILSASSAFWIWLPDETTNSLFRTVALAGRVADFATRAGVPVVEMMDGWSVWSLFAKWLIYGGCLAAIILAARRSRYVFMFVIASMSAVFLISDFRISEHSRYQARASQFSPQIRSN